MANTNEISSRPWKGVISRKLGRLTVPARDKQAPQPETAVSKLSVEQANEAKDAARKASEMANEAAAMARESVARSARATRELAQEARRKAKAAQIAAFKARKQARLSGKIAKEAKNAGIEVAVPANVTTAEQAKEQFQENELSELARGNIILEQDLEKNGSGQEKTGADQGNTKNETDSTTNTSPTAAAAGTTGEVKSAGADLFEGRIDVLLRNANSQQAYNLAEALRPVENLNIIISGSSEGGRSMVLQANQPIPLIDILRQIPSVDEITQFGWKEIQLSLKEL